MKIENKSFRYPDSMKFQKDMFMFLGSFITLILLFLLIGSLFNFPQGASINYPGMIFATLFMLFWIFQVSSTWPNIDIDDEGLWVEFGWKYLRVSWNMIVDIRRIKFRLIPGRIWLVRTKALTPLHIIYGILYTGSFQPGFLIDEKLKDHSALIQIINSNKGKVDIN